MVCVKQAFILWMSSRQIAGPCPARAAMHAVIVTTAMTTLYGTVWNTRQGRGKKTFKSRNIASILIFSTVAANTPKL